MTIAKKKHPISLNHPDYAKLMGKVKRCRDACGGSDRIKDAGVEYLPALSSHRSPEGHSKYEAYKQRALWYNASRRTKIGLSGAVTRSAPNIKTDAKHQGLAKEICRHYRTSVEELLEAGRHAVSVNANGLAKPETRLWWAENIVNWSYTRIDGRVVLRFVVLEDTEEVFGDEGVDAVEVTPLVVRHLYMLNKQGVCLYAKYARVDGKEEQWGEVVPLKPVTAIGGRALDFVPVKIVQALDDDDPEVQDPVMLDLVDVNISHYHNSADLEHGRHWTALPTAWASGFPTHDSDGNQIELSVGGESAWITETQGASAGYLEFSGAGLSHLADGMKDKQAMMAVLGARLLEEMKPAVESAETLKTRLAGDSSVLARICATTSNVLTWALQVNLFFVTVGYAMGSEENDLISVSDDIFNEKMSDAELTSLVSALQSNAVSYQVFFEKLKQGKIIPASRTIEEEIAAIDAGRPGNNDPFANSGGGGFGRW